jgi:hypothetical protein
MGRLITYGQDSSAAKIGEKGSSPSCDKEQCEINLCTNLVWVVNFSYFTLA